MKVGLLTIEQKNEIQGQMYAPDSYFNPIQDADNSWVISTEEMAQCIVEEFMWIKDLPLIEYVPPITPTFPPIK
jgi:hypothetical protein